MSKLHGKRLELLGDVPAGRPSCLTRQSSRCHEYGDDITRCKDGALASGLQIRILNVSTSREIDAAFAAVCAWAAWCPVRRPGSLPRRRRDQFAQQAALTEFPPLLFEYATLPRSAA